VRKGKIAWNGTSGRVVIALAVGAIAGMWLTASLLRSHEVGADFTWPWRAARALLRGLNPYVVIRPIGAYPFDAYFKYPLPAALFAVPLSPLGGEAAAGVFIAVSVALLAWALTRTDPIEGLENRWPLLLSGCVFSSIRSAQWAPLLAAAALLSPWAIGLGIVKPNLGIAMFAARPSWRAAMTGLVILAISLAVLPRWPLDWLNTLRARLEVHYRAPVAGGPGLLALGPLLLIVLLRWRRPEARLIAVLACMPQVPTFYDQLLVLTYVARTRLESAVLALPSMAAAGYMLSQPHLSHDQTAVGVLLTVYLPSTVLVLRRPNVST
jgi:hypothetical protein